MSMIVVGSGIFGVTAALELQARGHRVTLLDAGDIPHPDAASTDISKVVRMEYGPDEHYMAMVEDALEGWDRWNEVWASQGRGRLYHETGVLMVCRDPMSPGGFEFESWQLLNQRSHTPLRMTAEGLAAEYPAWSTGNHVDGFYHARGGFAESGDVVVALAEDAGRAGVTIRQRFPVTALVRDGQRVVGVAGPDGEVVEGDEVVLATGAWLSKLVPELAPCIRSSGHPVIHYAPSKPELFHPDVFPVFMADVGRTGLYGFPLSADGVVKIATHRLGADTDPDGSRDVTAQDLDYQRTFLRETFPALADAPVMATRLCLYADTQDGDFWIARHPDVVGLTVATGGSGHGFKFAPVLGGIIADAVEGVNNDRLERFRWRQDLRLDRGGEAARNLDP